MDLNLIKWYIKAGLQKNKLVTTRIPKNFDLTEFCSICDKLGWLNNRSPEALKFNEVAFWGTFWNRKLISISGCQYVPEISDNTYRILFRGAQLPEFNKVFSTMSRYHFNSLPFYCHALPAMKWAGLKNNFVITTSAEYDRSGKMGRTHRALELMAKLGLVTYKGIQKVSYTDQAVWQVNVKTYMEKRKNAKMEQNPLFTYNG